MADVYIVVFSLLGILITLPALLVALNLLSPRVTTDIATRLEISPGKSFVLGVPVAFAFLLWILITSQINFGLVQATAFLAAVVGMGLGTLGAAGMARFTGKRLKPLSDSGSEIRDLVRGAIVFELACLVPIVGWFLFIPLVGVTVMGAALFGLLGWMPRPQTEPPPVQLNQRPAMTEQQG